MTMAELVLIYRDTDAAIGNLSKWTVDEANLKRQYQTKDNFQIYLDSHRYKLNPSLTDVTKEIGYYTNIIDTFLLSMYKSINQAKARTLWKWLVSYQVGVQQYH
jgi:hypothetical protein